jgi:cytochrome c biogenesis protein CcmG, thiol:disulfide interchange protein DsbE
MPSIRTLRGQSILLIASGVVLLILVGLVLALVKGVGGEGQTESTLTEAPEFTLEAFDGSTLALAEHEDQPILLYFWASWCTPCKTEAPLMEKLWAEYRDKGYLFIGMNIWDSETEARAFAEDYGLTFPTVRDRENKVYLDYGVESLPLAFFLRPGLEVDQRHLGELKEADLRSMLDDLVATR